jgi:N-methylhydantoinase B/oxoprolinase/acetone carboxylase alpha subunit
MENENQTLKELRASMNEIDAMRRVKDISEHEREALELTTVALRDAERLCIAKTQNQLIKDLQAQTASLNEQAKVIRARVTKMNKMPKVLDNIESIIKTAVKIVAAIAKWL